ncbi:MAG: cobyric acid synthase, partial [Syntrophales bacterium]|nr:cobyric acid synthase [Syntrophales bacterium]
VGTMEVLAEWERGLVAGFVINRFRGQESLLQDAIDYTTRHTGCPTFGIVPYIPSLGLPEEDSVTFKSGAIKETCPEGEAVDIAVIDLPHISNFTDFDSLRIEPDVRLRIVKSPDELGRPDAIILPGSKNTIGDLDYLNNKGFVGIIRDLARSGRTEVIGVCGGFQILGSRIADPYGIESGGRTLTGLRLLAVDTTMEPEKTLRSVMGRHVASGITVRGYEIHHGQTAGAGLIPSLIREDGDVIGLRSEDGLCWGTYLHGIFDDDAFRRWFVDRLRVRRGMAADGKIRAIYDLEPAFERLADVVRRSLDMDRIYRLMELK